MNHHNYLMTWIELCEAMFRLLGRGGGGSDAGDGAKG